MKKTLCAIAILLVISFLFACTATDEVSAYAALGENEKKVFDALIIAINQNFPDPNSVRILAAGEMLSNTITLQMSASNQWGGTVTEWYCLVHNGETYGEIMYAYAGRPRNDVDCTKLNQALNEYYRNLGY